MQVAAISSSVLDKSIGFKKSIPALRTEGKERTAERGTYCSGSASS
jgi:hypothetical protein